MKIHLPFQKIAISLFKYFSGGAKIAATIELQSTSRIPVQNIIKPGVLPTIEDNFSFYKDTDITKRWELVTNAKLILKNNSNNYAYNLIITNGLEIFSNIESIEKLLSIAPNEKKEILVSFRQFVIEDDGICADKHLGIPNYIKNRYLKIQYENEAGVKFLTKSLIDFNKVYNIYSFS